MCCEKYMLEIPLVSPFPIIVLVPFGNNVAYLSLFVP